MSLLKIRAKRKIRQLIIATAAAQAGTTGVPWSIELTANLSVDVWTLISGANFTLIETDGSPGVNSTLSLLDTSVAGPFTAYVKASDSLGRINTMTITVTLSGTAGLGQVVGLSVPSTTPTTITMTHTALAGATYYEAALDRDLDKPCLLGTPKVVGVARPGVDCIVQVRGRDAGGNAGAWSAEVPVTVTDLSDPGPASVQQASRARDVTNAHVMQFSFHYWQSIYGFYYYGNNTGTLTNGTFVAGGWVKDHLEPLVNVGLKYYRTTPNGHAVANSLGSILGRNLFSTYGLKQEATLNFRSFDAVTASMVMDNIRNPAKGNYASAIRAFAGLNEPNYVGEDPEYAAAGTNWKNEVIAQAIAIDAAITAGGASYSTVEHYCYSPWGRRDMEELIAHTDPLGRTWTTHAAPLIDKLNLHYYTGGRRPEVSGAPSGTDQGGTALSEVSLDWTMDRYEMLSPAGTPLDFVMTEMGNGRLNNDPNQKYVSINTARKYNQRMLFENLLRNIKSTVYFQFLQTDLTMDFQLVDYSISGGVCTFTRLSPYTTVLNTLTAFYDSGGTAETFTPGTLDFTLSADAGAPNDYDQRIHHKLFQKANLEFYLAVWYEKDSWNITTKAESFGSRTVKLTLGSAKTVSTNRPYTNTTFTSLGSITTTNLTVNDDVLVVKIV